MFSSLDLEQNDAQFVEATKDLHDREMKIAKLTISRNWALMGCLFQCFILLLVLLLDSHLFLSQSPLQIAVLIINVVAFSHLDTQIKVLKMWPTI